MEKVAILDYAGCFLGDILLFLGEFEIDNFNQAEPAASAGMLRSNPYRLQAP